MLGPWLVGPRRAEVGRTLVYRGAEVLFKQQVPAGEGSSCGAGSASPFWGARVPAVGRAFVMSVSF